MRCHSSRTTPRPTIPIPISLFTQLSHWSGSKAQLDDAVAVTDQEAVFMAHYLMRREGLFVGSSSAMNVVATVRYAKSLPAGSTLVTVLCDSGQRHVTRFWNEEFILARGLRWPDADHIEVDAAVEGMAAGQQKEE